MSGRVEGARVDTAGVGLSAVGLAATVYALIESQRDGWTDPMVITPLVIGIAALAGFVSRQHRSRCPMLPLPLFAFRNFAAANLITAFVYGALTLGSLAIALYAQEIGGYSATAAGLATLPIPALSFVFARHVGHIAARVGPRGFLIAGPALAGIGLLLIRPKPNGFHAITDLVPGMTVLAIGLVATVTPLMSITLASVPTEHSGVASAINNAVSRLAALMSIGSMGLISAGAERRRIRPRVRGERGTIRPRRVVRRAVDHQSPCRMPTCALRHRGVVSRPTRCAARAGQQAPARPKHRLRINSSSVGRTPP